VFNYYAVGSFNIEITEDNLKLFAKEIEALSKVNNVVLDDVNQRSKLLKGFVEYVENEFDTYAYTPDIKDHINNYIKTL
jgi:hypothetical protein